MGKIIFVYLGIDMLLGGLYLISSAHNIVERVFRSSACPS